MNRQRPRPDDDVLTPREWEVLALVERGMTNEEIAESLGISPTTAKYHVSQILMKLDLPNRREARAWRARRVPAVVSAGGVLKNAGWLAATAAVGALIFVLAVLLLQGNNDASAMGKIAYLRDGDVWVKELPSGSEKQLTRWGDVTHGPQWSPSGDWLLVVRDKAVIRENGFTANSTWVIDANGKRERQYDGFVQWSPVADKLLLAIRNADDNLELVVEHPDGSNRRVLLVSTDEKMVSFGGGWSPDGDWVMGSFRGRDPNAPFPGSFQALVRIRADGTGEHEFYRHGTREPERNPNIHYGFLTESHYFVTFYHREGRYPPSNLVHAIAVDGVNEVITGPTVMLSGLSFARSPVSGRLVAVVGPEDATLVDKRIAYYDPARGEVEYLTAPGEAAAEPSWSADGRTLLFVAADGSLESAPEDDDPVANHRIWSMDADGGSRKQLTHDPRYRDAYPRMTSEGTHVLFARIDLETENGEASLWLLDIASGQLTRVLDRLDRGPQAGTSFGGTLPIVWDGVFGWWQPK